MTDLVQKIADAGEPVAHVLGLEVHEERYRKVVIRDGIGRLFCTLSGSDKATRLVRAKQIISGLSNPTQHPGRVAAPTIPRNADLLAVMVETQRDELLEAHNRIATLEAQLAESAKCAFEYAAKVGELERELAESREREGRIREAICHYEAALKAAHPYGAEGQAHKHWNEARKTALAADQEKK